MCDVSFLMPVMLARKSAPITFSFEEWEELLKKMGAKE